MSKVTPLQIDDLDTIVNKYLKLPQEDRIALVETLPDGKHTTLGDFMQLLLRLELVKISPKRKPDISASNFASWLKKIENSTTDEILNKLSESGQNVWAVNEGLKSNQLNDIRKELKHNEKICNNSNRLTTYNYFVLGRKLRDAFVWFHNNRNNLEQKTWTEFYKTLKLGISQSYADKLRSLYLQLSVAPRLLYAETSVHELLQYGATFIKHLDDNADQKTYWGNVPGRIVKQMFSTGNLAPKMEIEVLPDAEKEKMFI